MKVETVREMISTLTEATKTRKLTWERDNKPGCFTVRVEDIRFTVHKDGLITVWDSRRSWYIVPETRDYLNDLIELVDYLEGMVGQAELEQVLTSLKKLMGKK